MKRSDFEKAREAQWRESGLVLPRPATFPDINIECLVRRDVEAAEAAGVVWEPEERPLPDRVELSPAPEAYLIDAGPGRRVWGRVWQVDGELALAEKKRIAAAVCDAYNRYKAGELVPSVDWNEGERLRELQRLHVEIGHLRSDRDIFKEHAEEAEAALHRLAKAAKVADDGPDEIVNAVIKKMEMFLAGCERRAGALHRLAKEAGVSNIDGDEAVVDAVLKKIDNAEGMRAKRLRRSRGLMEEHWSLGGDSVGGMRPNNVVWELYRILTESEVK